MPNVPILNVGGTDYNIKDAEARKQFYHGIDVHFQPANAFYGKTVEFDYSEMPIEDGYLATDGSYVGATHKHFIMNAYGIKSVTITIPQSGTSLILLATKDNNDVIVPRISLNESGTKKFIIPTGFEGELIFNYFLNGSYPDKCTIEYYPIKEIQYENVIKKPYVFTGKVLHFYGDSITLGYMANEPRADNPYPETFSASVGASCDNRGVSGSGFSKPSDNTILQKIQYYSNLNIADTIFIAAGVNDWQEGATEQELETALETLCTYLKTNYTNGDVIFITPINESGRVPNVTPTQTLQSVRNIITRVAIKYGYSVLQGYKFPFPDRSDVSAYKQLMFQDNLHPTEIGYKTYAECLKTYLC